MTGEIQVPRSYRRGDWFGIFGSGATVLLPASEKARVPDLWVLVDDGAGFDRLLDALVGGGLSGLPAFVLVGHEQPTRVVVRGAATAALTLADGTTEELDGTTAATWVERSVPDLAALSLRVADAVDESDLPIEDGLVRVARVDQPPYVAWVGEQPDEEAAPVVAAEVEDDVAAEEGEDDVATGVIPVDAPMPEAAMSPEPMPEASMVEEPMPEASVAEEPMPEAPGALPPPPPSGGDAPWGPPVDAPAGPPPSFLPPPPAAEPLAPVDHDGLTRAGSWDPDKYARQHPGIPGQPPAPSVTAEPVARLQFSNGETVDVDRAVLIGRAPEARRFTSTEQPRLVTVPSPQQEISSTHLEVRPGSGADHGSAVVTDMGSTNGTVLQQPGLPPEDLQPGLPVQLLPGAVIDLGDGVTIRVTQP